MNLSRAENLMSQKHSIQQQQGQQGQPGQPPPLPTPNRDQMLHQQPYPPGQHSPASSSSSDMPPMRGATAVHPNHAQLYQIQQQQQQQQQLQHQQLLQQQQV